MIKIKKTIEIYEKILYNKEDKKFERKFQWIKSMN